MWSEVGSKVTTEKIKALFQPFEVPRWKGKGVWIRRLEQKMGASDLLQSSLYIVNINNNHLPTEKKTNMKVRY